VVVQPQYVAEPPEASYDESGARPLEPAVSPLPVIHMFWSGAPLTRLEQLSMSSFVYHGHHVILHAYDPPVGVPPGVTLSDAQKVLPRSRLFHDKENNSPASFADWFRFQVLYDQGGIWADSDIVCLKPLRYKSHEVFGWEDDRTINIAVLGLPRGHKLAAWMLQCWEDPDRRLPYDNWRVVRRKWLRRMTPGDSRPYVRWGEYGTMGFTQAARHLGYDQLALPFWHFYPIHFLNWRTIFDGSLRDNPTLTQASYAIHLWNEMTRRANFDKNGTFPSDSLFERLCARYLNTDSSVTAQRY
jgi:hypothetical protein